MRIHHERQTTKETSLSWNKPYNITSVIIYNRQMKLTWFVGIHLFIIRLNVSILLTKMHKHSLHLAWFQTSESPNLFNFLAINRLGVVFNSCIPVGHAVVVALWLNLNVIFPQLQRWQKHYRTFFHLLCHSPKNPHKNGINLGCDVVNSLTEITISVAVCVSTEIFPSCRCWRDGHVSRCWLVY